MAQDKKTKEIIIKLAKRMRQTVRECSDHGIFVNANDEKNRKCPICKKECDIYEGN